MARDPIHPGEHLREELAEIELSVAELAAELDVPSDRVTALLEEREGIDGDVALRLGKYLGTAPAFWMNLQAIYELRLAERRMGDALDRITTRSHEVV